jgi:hypothetical protein
MEINIITMREREGGDDDKFPGEQFLLLFSHKKN